VQPQIGQKGPASGHAWQGKQIKKYVL